MEKYLLEALFRMGDTEAALARLKNRYRKMVESDLTTLWEGWGIGAEGYGGGSYNHGWSGGPLTLLGEYVAGIAPTSPGFETFRVKPQPGPLQHISAAIDTVRGKIAVRIDRTDTTFNLRLTSPENTLAEVVLPAGKTITSNGNLLWTDVNGAHHLRGAQVMEADAKHVRIRCTPGNWNLTVALVPQWK
jgi:alpha-L-rhamnosidase